MADKLKGSSNSYILRSKGDVVAFVTNECNYNDARRQAELLSQQTGLPVADLPRLIQGIVRYPELNKILRPTLQVCTRSSERVGRRRGDRFYEIWHPGNLAINDSLTRNFRRCDLQTPIPIPKTEWEDIGRGYYAGQPVMRVHLEAARSDDVPRDGAPYLIYVNMDKDPFKVITGSTLKYYDAREDDRLIMFAGSGTDRDALVELFFSEDKENLDSVGNYLLISNGHSKQPVERLIWVHPYGDGISSETPLLPRVTEHFVGVDAGHVKKSPS